MEITHVPANCAVQMRCLKQCRGARSGGVPIPVPIMPSALFLPMIYIKMAESVPNIARTAAIYKGRVRFHSANIPFGFAPAETLTGDCGCSLRTIQLRLPVYDVRTLTFPDAVRIPAKMAPVFDPSFGVKRQVVAHLCTRRFDTALRSVRNWLIMKIQKLTDTTMPAWNISLSATS